MGMGFVIAKKEPLDETRGNAHSLSLDLYEQWQYMHANGQWRFTPPIHCLMALEQALRELDDEGGVAARHRRYQENARVLIEGMGEMGFETLLPNALQSSVIVTFPLTDNTFAFQESYDRLNALGFVIYPGKLTGVASFRVGCIGRLDVNDMQAFIAAVRQVLGEMGVPEMS